MLSSLVRLRPSKTLKVIPYPSSSSGAPPKECPTCNLEGDYKYRQLDSPLRCGHGHTWFLCKACSYVTIKEKGCSHDDISCGNKGCLKHGKKWINL